MLLRDLHLMHFKSWSEASFEFAPKLNCFIGLNGSGKTNLLDAIHYLSLTKSYFSSSDQYNIQHGADFFSISGQAEDYEGQREKLYCAVQKGQKKLFKKADKAYPKLSEHIGYLPAVVISPYDRNLITEGSELRRRFLDNVLSQSEATYLDDLLRYNKSLQQRNSLLKFFAANQNFDAETLEAIDSQMLEYGQRLFNRRADFCSRLNPRIDHYYRQISDGRETASLVYRSQLNEGDFKSGLAENLNRDRLNQYSSVGVHRDNLDFLLDGHSIRRYGSQGQQKSYLIALKLAQYEFIGESLNKIPLLLLDDIFDKLDEQRVAQLVQLAHGEHFGQIFITDTHRERTERLISEVDPQAAVYNTADLK